MQPDCTTALIPVKPNLFLAPTVLDTVNLPVAMAGLSVHTARAYQRWQKRYIHDVMGLPVDVTALDPRLALSAITTAHLRAWLGTLKDSSHLGKQSLGQARASVVWLAQFLADMEYAPYTLPASLSRVKMPKAETGQRAGTWLEITDVKRMLAALAADQGTPALVARNVAMVTLLVTCGIRRAEVCSTTWGDITKQGHNAVLRIHGKGEKLRAIKLPGSVIEALDKWRFYHPGPTDSAPIFTRIHRGGHLYRQAIGDRTVWLIVQRSAMLAGLPKIAPHDLRRTFARGAYDSGASMELVRQALGHANVATTEKYIAASLELDRAATDVWADAITNGISSEVGRK